MVVVTLTPRVVSSISPSSSSSPCSTAAAAFVTHGSLTRPDKALQPTQSFTASSISSQSEAGLTGAQTGAFLGSVIAVVVVVVLLFCCCCRRRRSSIHPADLDEKSMPTNPVSNHGDDKASHRPQIPKPILQRKPALEGKKPRPLTAKTLANVPQASRGNFPIARAPPPRGNANPSVQRNGRKTDTGASLTTSSNVQPRESALDPQNLPLQSNTSLPTSEKPRSRSPRRVSFGQSSQKTMERLSQSPPSSPHSGHVPGQAPPSPPQHRSVEFETAPREKPQDVQDDSGLKRSFQGSPRPQVSRRDGKLVLKKPASRDRGDLVLFQHPPVAYAVRRGGDVIAQTSAGQYVSMRRARPLNRPREPREPSEGPPKARRPPSSHIGGEHGS